MLEIGKRRSPRRGLETPIRVFGTDFQGRDFVEDSTTLVVSRHGAKIQLMRKLIPEQEIQILCQGNKREAPFRVVSQAGQITSGFSSWGVECLNPDENIWEGALPRPRPKPELRPSPQHDPKPASQLGLRPSPQLRPKPGPQLDSKLPPGLASTPSPQLHPKPSLLLDPKLDPQFSPKPGPQLDSKLPPGLASRPSPQLHPKPSLLLDPKLNPQFNSRPGPQLDPKLPPRLASRPGPQLDPKLPPRLASRPGLQLDPKLPPPRASRPGSQLDPNLASKLSWKDKAALQVILRCANCGMRELVDLSERQIQNMRKSKGLLRDCPACGTSSVWKGVAVQRS